MEQLEDGQAQQSGRKTTEGGDSVVESRENPRVETDEGE